MIKLENVTKVYKGDVVALKDGSFEINKGEFVFLVGPSGSGKSTLLRLLNREESPQAGHVFVAGKDIGQLSSWKIPYLRRNIGSVYQDYKLLSDKTVYENVAFALEVIGRPRHVIRTQVPAILELVGLAKKQQNYPDELSGGEQQRVSIARAFVNRPLILLADEPTGNLDPTTSVGIMRLLDRINRTGTTVVMATHDRSIVDTMRRRVIELDRGTIIRDQARGVYEQDHPNRMALNVNYVARETAHNLTRNPTLTIASIITVAVSLAFAGVGLLVRQGVDNLSTQFRGDVEIIVFLQPKISTEQREAIEASLEENPKVKDFVYFNQKRAFEEAQELFKDDPIVIQYLRQEDVPPSFRITPTNPDYDAVLELQNFYATKFGGVFSVQSAAEAIRAIQEMSDQLNLGVWVASVALGLNAILLIYNSIRTAMFARRREIEVMKLVGATNWFIRVPFMLEGLVQALLGGIIALLGLLALNKWGFNELANNQYFDLLRSFEFSTGTVIAASIVPIIIGVIIGIVGSGFAVGRFLDV